jgi:hypothetical protein
MLLTPGTSKFVPVLEFGFLWQRPGSKPGRFFFWGKTHHIILKHNSV